jgi:hypothetical protein
MVGGGSYSRASASTEGCAGSASLDRGDDVAQGTDHGRRCVGDVSAGHDRRVLGLRARWSQEPQGVELDDRLRADDIVHAEGVDDLPDAPLAVEEAQQRPHRGGDPFERAGESPEVDLEHGVGRAHRGAELLPTADVLGAPILQRLDVDCQRGRPQDGTEAQAVTPLVEGQQAPQRAFAIERGQHRVDDLAVLEVDATAGRVEAQLARSATGQEAAEQHRAAQLREVSGEDLFGGTVTGVEPSENGEVLHEERLFEQVLGAQLLGLAPPSRPLALGQQQHGSLEGPGIPPHQLEDAQPVGSAGLDVRDDERWNVPRELLHRLLGLRDGPDLEALTSEAVGHNSERAGIGIYEENVVAGHLRPPRTRDQKQYSCHPRPQGLDRGIGVLPRPRSSVPSSTAQLVCDLERRCRTFGQAEKGPPSCRGIR